MPDVGLRWAIKLSFQRYLAALPDGAFSARAGASTIEAHQFLFERVEATNDVLKFKGELEFTGHHGALRVRVVDPWLERTGPSTAVITSMLSEQRIELAKADQLVIQDGVWRSEHVTLGSGGATMFGGTYAPGEALEPFRAQ